MGLKIIGIMGYTIGRFLGLFMTGEYRLELASKLERHLARYKSNHNMILGGKG